MTKPTPTATLYYVQHEADAIEIIAQVGSRRWGATGFADPAKAESYFQHLHRELTNGKFNVIVHRVGAAQ